MRAGGTATMPDNIMEFCSDGSVKCLYHEAIDLRSLGRLSIRRASRIEFSHEHQMWTVTLGRSRKPSFLSRSRQECLDWENAFLSARL